jgi:hypothetical protein
VREFVVSSSLSNNSQGKELKTDANDVHVEVVFAFGRDDLFREDLVATVSIYFCYFIALNFVLGGQILIVGVYCYPHALSEFRINIFIDV